MSVLGVVSMGTRVPLAPKKIKVAEAQKKKATVVKTKTPGGTNAGHYTSFINNAMDEMDKYPQFKRFYMTMDRQTIHGKNGEPSLLIDINVSNFLSNNSGQL